MIEPKLNIDEAKLNAFMGKAVTDMGAAINTSLVILGDRLGLYKAMAGAGPMTSEEVAKKTGTSERYIREWLSAQAAGGYISWDATTGKFTLPDEQALALAVDNSPAFIPGAYQIIASTVIDEPKLREAFKSGTGVGWHEHNCNLFEGTERFFRPGYAAHLVKEWIPSLEGVEEKLKKGASVADVGCGFGASTILMAQAYPNSKFIGFDYHAPSIEWATKSAKKAGVGDRATFQVASSKAYPRKRLRRSGVFRLSA